MDGAHNAPAADAVRQRCEACIKARDLTGALEAGRELCELTPQDYQAWRLYAKAASLQPDHTAELAVLDAWLDAFPNRPRPALRMANLYLQLDDADNAEAAFQRACANGLDEYQQLQYRQEDYWRREDWMSLSTMSPPVSRWEWQIETAPWLRVAIARFYQNDVKGGLYAVESHLTGNPGEFAFIPFVIRHLLTASRPQVAISLINHLRRLDVDTSELDKAVNVVAYFFPNHAQNVEKDESFQSDVAKDHSPDVVAWLDTTLRLKFETPDASIDDFDVALLADGLQKSLDGELEDALSCFNTCLEQDWPPIARSRIAEIQTLLVRMVKAGPPNRAIIRASTEEVIVSESLGTGRLAIVFTGIGGKVSGMPLTFFDRILAASGYQAVYLRDASRCLFCAGIRSTGGTAQATLAELRKLTDELGHNHLITLGVSAGGYAGLRYGLELEADRVLAFSPLTAIETEVRRQMGDERLPALGNAIQRRVTDADFFTPVWDVMTRKPYSSAVEIFTTEGSEPDIGHAQKMIGLPGVTVHMIKDSDRHDCLMTALTTYPDLLEP